MEDSIEWARAVCFTYIRAFHLQNKGLGEGWLPPPCPHEEIRGLRGLGTVAVPEGNGSEVWKAPVGRFPCSGSWMHFPRQPVVPNSSLCHSVSLVCWLQRVCVPAGNHTLRMPCPGALKSPAVPLPGKKFFLASLRRVLFLFEIFFQLCALCVWRVSARGCTGSHVWSSAHRSWGLVLSFHHVCTGWFRWSDLGQEPLSTAPSSQSLFLCCSPLKFMSCHFLLEALLILCWAQMLPPQVPRALPPQAVSLVDLGHSAPRGVMCEDCGIISPFCNGYTR